MNTKFFYNLYKIKCRKSKGVATTSDKLKAGITLRKNPQWNISLLHLLLCLLERTTSIPNIVEKIWRCLFTKFLIIIISISFWMPFTTYRYCMYFCRKLKEKTRKRKKNATEIRGRKVFLYFESEWTLDRDLLHISATIPHNLSSVCSLERWPRDTSVLYNYGL